MITKLTPLDLSEVKELTKGLEDKKILEGYLKKFGKLKREKAKGLLEEIRALGNVKFKEEYLVKVVDFLPKDSVELNKIFNDISLDEKEINEILEIVKKY